MACLVIAEAGVNHNGSQDLALQLIEAAAAAGADAVKFQTFRAERLARPGAAKAAYQRAHTGAGDQFSMLCQLELPEPAYAALHRRCGELGIEFMSTPFDRQSAEMLIGLGMRRLKIPSGELTNLPFLEFLAGTELPLILSTGMGSLEEVREAVETIERARDQRKLAGPLAESLTLLHCTSNYPAALEDVNLRAMQTLRDEFRLPVGYSDHTEGTLIAVAAVAMGAVVLEKHFTLDRGLPGPDHTASLEPGELTGMVAKVRALERGLGDGKKSPRASELPIRDLVRRSATLKRSLKAEERISLDDLDLLRPGDGIAPKDLKRLVGKRVRSNLPAGTTLKWSDVDT
jgi:N,N'-diacetyllegionaminate synthase